VFFRIAMLVALALMGSTNAFAKQAEELLWDNMIPVLESQQKSGLPVPEGGVGPSELEDPYAYYDFENPVMSLDGKYVKVPGFIVPLESDDGGLLNEFLLVPYYGACIHTPPPPPNQVVYITLEEPFNLTSMYDAYWITGTISTQNYSGAVAETVYTLKGEKVEKYEW